MPDQFTQSDDTRRGYHSGLDGRVVDAKDRFRPQDKRAAERIVIFETSKYRPPFLITLRSEKNGWKDLPGRYQDGRWYFQLPGQQFSDKFAMKLVLAENFWMVGSDYEVMADARVVHLSDAQVQFGYEIRFETQLWQPNHLVTLRTSVDGWNRDIFGSYRDGGWHFVLDRNFYPDEFEAKFVLDQALFMEGDNLEISKGTPNLVFEEAQVKFATVPYAFRHGYDNFSSISTPFEQTLLPLRGREGETYDVIVIGSGMSGGALADALSDRGARVLVLDAGGLRFPVHTNELPRSERDPVGRDELGHFENHGTAHFNKGVHFSLGGRSVYWSGLIPRMQEWEFRNVWPAAVKTALKGTSGVSYYEKAEVLMRLCKTLGPFQNQVRHYLSQQFDQKYHVEDLPRSLHQPNLAPDGTLQNVIERSTGGFSTADLLLDSLGFSGKVGRDNLWVNLHHLATHIETSANKAVAVVCQDLVGRVERRYEASYIVLACGSLESAKLAKLSGLADPTQKIGVGLTDHPAYFYHVHHELPQTGPYAWIGDPKGHAKLMLRHKHATAAQHAYNIELLINPRYWDTRHADDDLWQSRVGGGPSKVEIKLIFDSLLNDQNKIEPKGWGQKPHVFVAKNQPPQAYKAEAVAARNEILQSLGVPEQELSKTWINSEWGIGQDGSVHHAGGTLRMSDNGTGVVDENLKFASYDNLYCCDVSVFPSIPAANPSLTVVALALRLADTLATRLSLP